MENWPRPKKALVNSRYPTVRGQCDESCLELGFDPVPKQTVFNVLQSIGRKLITYDNAFLMEKRGLLPDIQVKYVKGVIVERDKSNPGISRKEVIQVISDIGQEKLFVQAENHLDCLIRTKRLAHFKRLGRVVTYQSTTTEQSHICVTQQYRSHMMIEAKWGDLWRTNSPRDFFSFDHYFELNLDETSFLCNQGELTIIGCNDQPHHDKN